MVVGEGALNETFSFVFSTKDTVNMVAYLNVDKPLSPMFYRYL